MADLDLDEQWRLDRIAWRARWIDAALERARAVLGDWPYELAMPTTFGFERCWDVADGNRMRRVRLSALAGGPMNLWRARMAPGGEWVDVWLRF
jgi:hypothetical protein